MAVGAGEPPLHIVVATRAAAPQHGYGGLERAVTAHIGALARHGARLTVFTQPDEANLPLPDTCGGLVTWRAIPYRRYPLRRNSIPDRLLHYFAFAHRVGRAITALAQAERVDIVHAHGLAGLGYAAERHRAARPLPPLVLNPHGLEEFSRQHRAKWLAYAPFRRGLRQTARQAATTIATDRALIAPIQRHLGLATARLTLLPNGVELAALDALDQPAMRRAVQTRYRLAESPLTLVSVARLELNKGLSDGLAALAQLRDQLPPGWRWLIVGQGAEEAPLRALLAQHRLGDNVTLVGALPDPELHSLLACADLCLVPSRYEGSSLTALEALAHRLPVVATPVGGLPDKVIPGQTGFLAATPDPTAFAAALAEALAARAQWPAYGARARALVEREFDWAALGGRYLALYQELRAYR